MVGKYMEIGVPEKIDINKNFQHLRIVRKWFGLKFIFFTLFVLVWDAFLINWYVMAFSSTFRGAFDYMIFLFPLLHVSFGVGMTYYVLAGYLNKTIIDVDFNSLTIRHGPLPFWGNKRISSKMIIQLFCKNDFSIWNRNMWNRNDITVHAITSEQRNIKLLSGLDNSDQALFIEQEIEKFLNIEDRPVKGEIR
jgi:hypothetical protein